MSPTATSLSLVPTNTQKPEISLLRYSEWEVLRAVRLRALERSPTCFPDVLEAELKLTSQDWEKRLTDSIWVVARQTPSGSALGVARLKGIPTSTHGPERPSTVRHIESVWVDPAWRTRGIARAMLEMLEREAIRQNEQSAQEGHDRIEKLLLWVLAGNTRAHEVYLRTGFSDTGWKKTLVMPDGRAFEEIRMEKPLGSG